MHVPEILFGPATDALGRWRNALIDAANLSGKGQIYVESGATGRVLKVEPDRRRFVRLSGSASPYTGTEVYPAASGTWTNLPGVPTVAGIYEDNGVTGLSGKVVRVRPALGAAAGEWRFTYRRQKAATATPCAHVTATLKGCNSAGIAGQTVTLLKSGVAVSSAVTNSSGVATLPYYASGSGYSIVPPTITGYTTPATWGPFTLSCPANGVASFTYSVASGYSCSSCCTETGPPYADVTWPTTVYVNDGIGTVALTGGGAMAASATPHWYGVASRTAATNIAVNGDLVNCVFVDGGKVVNVYFEAWICNRDLTVALSYYPARGCSGCRFIGAYNASTGTCDNAPPAGAGFEDVTCENGFLGDACSGAHASATAGPGFGPVVGFSVSTPCPPSTISASGTFNVGSYAANPDCSLSGGLLEHNGAWYYWGQIYGSTYSGGNCTVSIPLSFSY